MSVQELHLIRPDRTEELLREYESYCYRIAYCLLRKEIPAAEAAGAALLELAGMRQFLTGTKEERQKLAKKAAIRNACRAG